MNQNADETRAVSVSEDYLAFLHDELSENQIRLREILGESQAKAVFSWSADRFVTTAEAVRYIFDPVEEVVRRLKGWGMTVSLKEKGRETELEVRCPYAEHVHPRLSSKEPRCPLGEYILGAIRLEDPKSQFMYNSLTKEGVRFTIERPSVVKRGSVSDHEQRKTCDHEVSR